jgi:hypothetical protein
MTPIEQNHHALNQLCEAGKPMEGFERFYAESVTMQENQSAPRLGKALNRAACQQFVDQAPDLKMQVIRTAVSGNVSFTEMRFQYTGPDQTPIDYQEVAVREWADGLVVREQFYYTTE